MKKLQVLAAIVVSSVFVNNAFSAEDKTYDCKESKIKITYSSSLFEPDSIVLTYKKEKATARFINGKGFEYKNPNLNPNFPNSITRDSIGSGFVLEFDGSRAHETCQPSIKE